MTTRLRQMKVAHEPPGHPCRALEPSARHGDGSPELATPGRARHAETSRAFEGKAPLANLCNRLVVNEHPLDLPTLGRWALACSPTAFPLSPPTCALAQAAMIEPSTVTSDSRKRHLRPRAVTRLVPLHRWSPFCHRSPKGAPSIVLGQDPRWFVRPRVSRAGAETDAPCHARFPRRLSPSRSSGAEDLSGGLRQVRRLPDPERLPPTSPSRHPPPLARAQPVRRPPLVPRLGRLSPASDTLSRVGTR